jgi:hypothetical protein
MMKGSAAPNPSQVRRLASRAQQVSFTGVEDAVRGVVVDGGGPKRGLAIYRPAPRRERQDGMLALGPDFEGQPMES